MKNILKIYKSDLRGLMHNFFALVVAAGLCLLPALYAWFNIYANWDPYGNTGNIQIAVANLDKGGADENGSSVNMGESIEESLRESDSIGWVFVDSEDAAVNGVKSGEYYAALVIDADFTSAMYLGVTDSEINPEIKYYVNDKKNAVATKITDTAVSTVQHSINEQFISVAAQQFFSKTNEFSAELTGDNKVEAFIHKLENVNDSLKNYDAMIDSFVEANTQLSDAASEANDKLADGKKRIDEGEKELRMGQQKLDTVSNSFKDFNREIESALDRVETELDTLSTQIDEAQLKTDVSAIRSDVEEIVSGADILSEELNRLEEVLGTIERTDGVDHVIQNVKNAKDKIKEIADSAGTMTDTSAGESTMKSLLESLGTYASLIRQARAMYSNEIIPQISSLMTNMSDVLSSVESLLNGMSATSDHISEVFTGVNTTLDTLNMSMLQLQGVLEDTSLKLDKVLERLQGASEEEQLQILMNLMAGDEESLSAFIAEPVQVEDHYIYEIANYGSGVTPFYTTLAIWVGMTILVSLIKVHADKEQTAGMKLYQLFFGRYMLFFTLSQIQTLIIVLGNLLVFHVQCLHPFLFWMASALTSLTFSLLIYSLTISFGDIGKAFAVVVMVIQIAGSGGTFPIEALPGFFQSVYIFFPFPYAINAMRECIGGMYENAFGWCLARLGFFCIGALVIGLVIRIPFIRMNHFFEKRMEDTDMM